MAPAPTSGATTTAAPVDEAQPLPVAMIAPMHGPVVANGVAHLVSDYKLWISEQIKAADRSNVLVLYASAYGNTTALAQAISRGITKAGVAVNTLNLEMCSLEEVTQGIKEADGFIIGALRLVLTCCQSYES